MIRRPPGSTLTDTLFPYTTLFRSGEQSRPVEASVIIASLQDSPSRGRELPLDGSSAILRMFVERPGEQGGSEGRATVEWEFTAPARDRKSTRLNSSH